MKTLHTLVCLLFLSLSGMLWASPPEVSFGSFRMIKAAEGVNTIENYLFFPVDGAIKADLVGLLRVKTSVKNFEVEVRDKDRYLIPFTKISNEYYIIKQKGKFNIKIDIIDFTNQDRYVENLDVEVKGDDSPDPGPEPTPTPDGSSPFVEKGLRVLIVYESADPKFNSAQQSIVYGPEFREFLNSTCVEWRLLDQDTSYTDPNNVWAKVLKREIKSLPWVIVGNGVNGYEGPLPERIEEMRALVSEFALQKSYATVAAQPVITMYSSDGCAWCNLFVRTQLPRLTTYPYTVRTTKVIPSNVTLLPSFSIKYGGKTIILSGYHTADSINNVIKGM